MKKTFISNLILVLFLNLSVKPFWIFAIDRQVQNIVGSEEYGTYYSLLGFSFVFNVILDFGITNFNNRNISQNSHLLAKHFSRVVILKLVLAAIYLAICCIGGLLIQYDFRLMKLLLILCFSQFLISFILYLRSNISGLHFFKTDSTISVTDRLIAIAVCAPILWGHFFNKGIDIMDYVYIQTISYFITAVIAFGIVVSKAGFVKFQWTRKFSIMILKQSFPFAVLGMLMAFYNRIDSVMLERLLHDNGREAGIYAQSFRLLDAANMIAFLFAGLLLPMFSRMLKHKESVEALVKTSFTLIMVLSITVACTCFFYGRDMMDMLYKNDVEESAAVFKYLMCDFMGISCMYIFGTLLTANGNLKQLNTIAACGMLLNIILNFILIPAWQAKGAAMVSVITQVFVAITQIILVQRIFKFHMMPKLLSSLILFAAGVIALNYLSLKLNFDWEITFICAVGASGVWAIAVGLLNIRSILNVVKIGST
jgi:O-antigen/teichoic acid export membrane protein